MSETEDSVRAKLTFPSLFLKLWPFIRQQPRRLVTAMALVLVYVAIGRSLPLLFGYAIDEGLRKQNATLVFHIAFLYLALDIARSALSYAQTYTILRLGNAVLYRIREDLILHMQYLPMVYFDKNASGRIMTRVTTDIANLGELFTDGFTAFFISVVEIISIVIALIAVSPTLTVLSLAIVPLSLFVTFQISMRIRDRFGQAKRKLSALNASAAETLNGLRVVHLFDQKNLRKKKFERLSEEYRGLQLQTVQLFAALWPVVEAFNLGTILSALLFGSFLMHPLGLTLGQLSAFILLIQSFFHPLRVILERYNQLQNSLASADRIFDMFQEPVEPDIQPGGLLTGGHVRGAISYQNVRFAYSADGPNVLEDVALEIQAGERVAFVGRTGSGKTTMISLLQKFYPLAHGQITMDGRSLRDYPTLELRSRFGVVLQDSFLFRGTLFENVTLRRTDLAPERVLQSVRSVGLDALLTRDQNGLDFKIEERGANLSFGERQLVSFARLLAFDPDVLILDEATSNIDSISEEKIQRAIEIVTKGRTSLIIAHRLSTIIHCDKIVVMDQGRIAEVGRHADLVARGGLYSELYRTQMQRSVTRGTGVRITL
jgi:ATP-binding cassette subfamily B protein